MLSRRVPVAAAAAAARRGACACGGTARRSLQPRLQPAPPLAAARFASSAAAAPPPEKKPAIRRFKDFHGRWHEGETDDDMTVFQDQDLSDQMRYWNTTSKLCGFSLWLGTVGVQFNLLGKVGLVDYEVIPGAAPWLLCGAAAAVVVTPATFYATMTMRRQLERHAYRVSVPAAVALTAERPELELTKELKDLVAGTYFWCIREALERQGKKPDSKQTSAIDDATAHQEQLDLEAGLRQRQERHARGEFTEDEQDERRNQVLDDIVEREVGNAGVCAGALVDGKAEVLDIKQFDLIDKLKQELLRPLSGIRAELDLQHIITNLERERIEKAAAALAVDPEAPADLQMFLRWFSRTAKVFTIQNQLKESPVDWWTYDPWGDEDPDIPPEKAVDSVTLSQHKWIGAQEIVTVKTTIPVLEQPIPPESAEMRQQWREQVLAEKEAAKERKWYQRAPEGEGVYEDMEYAPGSVGDFFRQYDLQPPFGGNYAPGEYYVNKPVFEPLVRYILRVRLAGWVFSAQHRRCACRQSRKSRMSCCSIG